MWLQASGLTGSLILLRHITHISSFVSFIFFSEFKQSKNFIKNYLLSGNDAGLGLKAKKQGKTSDCIFLISFILNYK